MPAGTKLRADKVARHQIRAGEQHIDRTALPHSARAAVRAAKRARPACATKPGGIGNQHLDRSEPVGGIDDDAAAIAAAADTGQRSIVGRAAAATRAGHIERQGRDIEQRRRTDIHCDGAALSATAIAVFLRHATAAGGIPGETIRLEIASQCVNRYDTATRASRIAGEGQVQKACACRNVDSQHAQ